MLLKAGADPNLKVYSDECDRNSQLRPVLVEYLASNEHPSVAVVHLLLQYGARVSITVDILTSILRDCLTIFLFHICLMSTFILSRNLALCPFLDL